MDISTIINQKIRDVPDFPKPGIMFKDITPLLADADTFGLVIETLTKRYRDKNISKIVGIESRGFIFGSALAHELGLGFTVVRKPGKLPFKTVRESYALEYGTDSLEIHVDALTDRDRVVIIDDLLATGGTAAATARLVKRFGANVHEIAFVIELSFLNGKKKLLDPSFALLRYD